jgi:hypothetical protein
MAFRFTTEAPSQQLYSDVQNLNQFSNEQLTQFTQIVLVHLTNPSDATRRLGEFGEEHGVNVRALGNTLRGVLFFFTGALKANLGAQQVKSDLSGLGLAEDKAELLSSQWQTEFSALARTMASRTLSVNQLVDTEWAFGVTSASSELNNQGSCFLQLKFVVDRGFSREDVVMELTLPQFYSFLSEMQAANRLICSMTKTAE